MKRILQLENELSFNKEKLLKVQTINTKEQRILLLQRSNLKDLLLEEYRKVTNVSNKN